MEKRVDRPEVVEEVNAKPFPFLRLPREIRDIIYGELLTRPSHDELWIRYDANKNNWWDGRRKCHCLRPVRCLGHEERLEPTILRLCKRVHEEALEILFGKNKVYIDAPLFKALEFLSATPIPALQRIKYLKICMDVFPNPILGGCGCAGFAEMLSQPSKPWHDLFTLIQEALPILNTLHLRCKYRTLQLSYIRPFDKWRKQFFRHGWMEPVREMTKIKTLHLEYRFSEDNLVGGNVDLVWIHQARNDLWEGSGFKEVSARWSSYLPSWFRSDMTKAKWYRARLVLSHMRKKSDEEVALPPLAYFTKEDVLDTMPQEEYCLHRC
ncbi:hypothetical protein BO78DRAFT_385285 [Aspergillus sclerotiicarbonarius CBS 121057]|uniref:F-box domain-containing protein n=1 Tax=Aspergillus sclerotiicarbonarius (strain CBS 121057 / IBT 28362) TaxID=1448318 RepID=A0A319EDS2_ASPSB|nr:hypothetical protein BO78DRAFT_385285 [Aspergillus sclerotiicarbonarius CBS 121057]